MKTELTLENKAKFFAQHWGQGLVNNINVPHYNPNQEISYHALHSYALAKSDYILLKDIKSISDIHASELAEMNEITIGNHLLDDFVSLNEFKSTMLKQDDYCYPAKFFDYLRLNGYAISWMGFSVDEMINSGWIKLTS